MSGSSKKSWRVAIIAGAVVIGLLVLCLFIHLRRSQNALDRYVAELRAQGEKLSVADLTVGAPPFSNSSPALFRAASKLKSAGFVPGFFEPRKFVKPGEAEVLFMQQFPPSNPGSRPTPPLAAGKAAFSAKSKPNTWADVRQYLNSNEAALAEIRQALQSPSPQSGIVPRLGGPGMGVNFVAVRQIAQWLSAATIADLHERNLDAALKNLEALGALARLNCEDYALVSQMIRVAITRLGLATTWEMLQAQDLTEAQLQRLQTLWGQVDILDGVERGLVGERAFGREIWKLLRTDSSGSVRNVLGSGGPNSTPGAAQIRDYVQIPFYRVTSINDDELFYLRTIQDHVDLAREIRAQKPWVVLKSRLDVRMDEINRMAATPQRWKYWLTLTVMPNFSRAFATAVHTEAERRMTLTVIGLKRYQCLYGAMPATLAELTPVFLPSAPFDPMNGQALAYHADPLRDGFTLYSVGDDGKDDGGDPGLAPKVKPDFWAGRDAVWPRAVAAPELAHVPEP